MFTDFIVWFRDHLSVFQFIFIFIGLAFLGITLYINMVLGLTKEKIDHWIDVVGSKDISRRNQLKIWESIKRGINENTPSSLRAALMGADRILEEILKVARFPGLTLDQKLENIAEEQIPNILELREAHALKNRIAKDPNLVLTQEETKNAIRIYARAFLHFGLLEDES